MKNLLLIFSLIASNILNAIVYEHDVITLDLEYALFDLIEEDDMSTSAFNVHFTFNADKSHFEFYQDADFYPDGIYHLWDYVSTGGLPIINSSVTGLLATTSDGNSFSGINSINFNQSSLTLTQDNEPQYGNSYDVLFVGSLGGYNFDLWGIAISGDVHDFVLHTQPAMSFSSPELLSFDLNFFEAGSVVPEPSTYALILGALALGFVALRRK